MDYQSLTKDELIEEINRLKRMKDISSYGLSLCDGSMLDIRTAVDASPVCIVITDLEGSIIYVNNMFTELTGYTEDEALGGNPRILQSGIHNTEFYKDLWDIILSGRVWRGVFQNRKKNGGLYREDASIAPIKDKDGIPVGFVAVKVDITEKKIFEEELTLKSMMLDEVMDNIFLIDMNGKIVYTNKSVESTHGYTVSEAVGMSIRDFNVEDDAALTSPRIIDIIKTGHSSFEVTHYRKDRTELPVEVSARLIENNGEKFILSVNRNIEQRKRMEGDLRRSEMMYRTLIAKLPDYVFVIQDAKLVLTNESLDVGLGFSVEDYSSRTVFDFIAEYDRDKAIKNMKARMAGEEISPYEIDVISKAGVLHTLIINAAVIDYEGSPAILAVGIDITDRKKIDNALRESENKLNAVINSIPNPVFYKDADLVYRLCNQAFCDFLGISREKIIGSTVYDIAPAELAEIYDSADRMLVETGEKNTYEAKVRYADGSLRDVLFYKSPLHGIDEKVIGLVGIMLDVTEMKESQNKLKLYADELRELNSTKDKFFSIISHDLKNPFHVLIGFSEMIMNYAAEFDMNQISEFGKLMNGAAVNGYRLLENLLDWSRSQTGSIQFKPEKISIRELTDEPLELVKKSVKDKNIIIDIADLEDIEVTADKNMIKTVFRNLISNAVKFSKPGGKISILAENNDSGMVSVTVSDNGVGISEENIPGLFRIDLHLSTEGTAGETGTGLGLILCREFIEKNGGTIRVESRPGYGSSFIFTLPSASR